MPSPIAIFLIALLSLAATGAGGASTPTPCDAEGATLVKALLHDAEGVFRIDGKERVRLANIVWPDHLEPHRRANLAKILAESLGEDVEMSWKPAAVPDRWGIIPAHLFLREKSGKQPAFWLQAGLVENGFVPVWPDAYDTGCRDRLLRHEAEAIRQRRGYWAPRAQAARHRAIMLAPEAHAGRRLVALWPVRSVRAWRMLHFVNFVPSFRGAPALGLTRKQFAQLQERGNDPENWRGKRIVARVILGAGGLSRLRIEAVDHVATIE